MKTTTYYICLTAIAAAMVGLALFFNESFNAQRHLSLPNTYFSSQTFSESLINQGIQNLKQSTSLLILQILVILIASRTTAFCFSFMGQTAVMGEIIGGILLGPSLLGLVAPSVSHFIFPADSLGRLQSLSQLWLIIYMFICRPK